MTNCSTDSLNTDRAVVMNITVRRNDSFTEFVTLLENGTPYDFTDFAEATMQVKTDTETETVTLLASITNTRLVLGGTAGTVTWAIPDTAMDIEPNTYVYDLEIYNSTTGERETIFKGNFIVNADVTRL